MKKIVLLGCTGSVGSRLRKMLLEEDCRLLLYVRSPGKLDREDFAGAEVVEGDVTNAARLHDALKDADSVVATLDGDLLAQAESLAQALQNSSVSRVIWLTGRGIHNEINGPGGLMLRALVKKMPDYPKAADTVAGAGVPCLLVRAPRIIEGEAAPVTAYREDEKHKMSTITTGALARWMADFALDDSALPKQASLSPASQK